MQLSLHKETNMRFFIVLMLISSTSMAHNCAFVDANNTSTVTPSTPGDLSDRRIRSGAAIITNISITNQDTTTNPPVEMYPKKIIK